MATLGLVSLALGLQVLAGLMVLLYTDFNPSRRSRNDPEEADNFPTVPRGETPSIDITSDDEFRRIFEENLEQAEGRKAYIHQMDQERLSEIESPQHTIGGRGQGINRELFSWWFTRSVRVRREEQSDSGDFGPWEDSRVYSPPWRPCSLALWQIEAFGRAFRQLSLLLVGVAALVRFAYGEPILNLF